MKKVIMVLIFSFLLYGCANKKEEKVEIKKEEIRRAPDVAMKKCEELKELKDGSFRSVVLKLQEISALYYECEEKRSSLQKFIENK